MIMNLSLFYYFTNLSKIYFEYPLKIYDSANFEVQYLKHLKKSKIKHFFIDT